MGDTTTQLKRCSRCKQIKDNAEFHADRRRKDGLQAMCKSCISAYQKRKEYDKHAPRPTLKGVQLAKKAIDVVEALPSNKYNMHQAFASVTGKDIKTDVNIYRESNRLWDDLADDEAALCLFRRYLSNDLQDIDLNNSFTRYFQEAMQNGSLGEKNSALQLTFKVLGWLDQKTKGNQQPKPKTPEERKKEREVFLLGLEQKAN